MGGLSIAVAVLGIAALWFAGFGKLVALGFGLFAIGLGVTAWRTRTAAPAARLRGAFGIALGIVAVVLGGLKIALTWVALGKLERFLGPP